MAVIGSSFHDLIDLFKGSDSDDAITIATVIEMLKEHNAILEDAMAVECNLGTRHRTTLRTRLPSGSWGRLYKGVTPDKSGKQPIEDTTGFFETLSAIDTRELKLSGNEAALRLSEANSHLETVAQNIADALIYGNEDLEPDKFTGFAPRFNSLTGGTGGQIVDGGGAGSDNTSVWFVTWGDDQSHMIYPRGTQAGVTREDKGEQRVTDENGDVYYVKEEKFEQHAGLVVRDYRHVARIANVPVPDLVAGTVDIYALMRRAFWKIKKHRLPETRQAIYCNSDVLEALDADATPTKSSTVAAGQTGTNVRLRPMEIDGQEVMTYRGIPVRQVDAILNTEAQVT